MNTAQQIKEWNIRQLIKTKYSASRWRHEKPKCEDFGFHSDEIDTIRSMQSQWERELNSSPYSQQLRNTISQEQKKDKIGELIIILAGIAVNIFLWGFIIIWLLFGFDNLTIVPIKVLMGVVIVLAIVIALLLIFQGKRTPRSDIERMKREEDDQHNKQISEKYGIWIRKAKGLEEYTEAMTVYNYLNKRSSYGFWRNLTGKGNEFEDEVRNFLESQGYEATRLPEGPDDGIDIVAQRNGIKYAVQCKAHEAKISPTVARDLAGVVAGGNYDRGMLFALNGVSENTRAWCKRSNVPIEIWTINEIVKKK